MRRTKTPHKARFHLCIVWLGCALLLGSTPPLLAQDIGEPPLRLEEPEAAFPQDEQPPAKAGDRDTTVQATPDVTVTTTDAPPPASPPTEEPPEATAVPPAAVAVPPVPPHEPEVAAPADNAPHEAAKKATATAKPRPTGEKTAKKAGRKEETENKQVDRKPAPLSPVAHLLSEGYSLLKARRLTTPKGQSAADRFRAVLKLAPDNREARRGLGEIVAIYLQWAEKALPSKPQKSLAYVAKALEIDPANAAAYRLKGRAHQTAGQWSQALSAYREAHKIAPDPRTDDFAIGHALAAGLKRYREALPHLEKMVKLMPDSAVLYNDLADSYHHLRMVPKAIAAVKERNRLERLAGHKVGAATAIPVANVASGTDTSRKRADAAFARGDYGAAKHAYFAAAAKGDAEASYRLGRMYHQGLGLKRDLVLAMLHYKQAALRGHPGGKAGLGYMYYRGLGGLPRNYHQAFVNFLDAANAGITGAQYRVGYMYEKGQGVARSSRKAAYWYVTAAQKGNRAARKRLIELKMKPRGLLFAAPAEINTGPGELPALSAAGVAAAAEAQPERKPPPSKPPAHHGGCGGLIGGLGGC